MAKIKNRSTPVRNKKSASGPKGLVAALRSSFLEVVRKTSAELPKDVIAAIQSNAKKEAEASRARYAMDIIQKNIQLAKLKSAPLCQDTGSILFFVNYPKGMDQDLLESSAIWAVKEATKKGFLRQNSVDSITGENSGDNVGPGTPTFHFHPWNKPTIDIRLMLKGGGCENVGAQYSLPEARISAGRDMDGVRRCILDAVVQAQGKGCGPGILGVTIGGDRATGYLATKEQFLRLIHDKNKDPRLALMENQIVEEANKLGIGPMGFGGKTTLLACKITALNRLPASFFVSVSYMCWAYRRQGALVSSKTGEIQKWIY